jgi:glycerol-3-phosphate acyltransferase PlsY
MTSSIDAGLLLAAFGVSYFLGSISTAILVCKFMKLPDPRQVGSGNPGATNVLRHGGKKAGFYTLLGDLLKGVVPVLSIHIGLQDPILSSVACIGAFLGHLYPAFFKFKGGKGVATGIGAILGFLPILGASLIAIWLFMAFVFRYSSLAAVTAAFLAPILTYFLYPGMPVYLITMSFLSALLIWRHRSNIKNLLSGKEDKIAAK